MAGRQILAISSAGLKFVGFERFALLGCLEKWRSAASSRAYAGVGLRRKRACLGERRKLGRRSLDAMRPNRRREIDVAAEGVLDLVVEAIDGFLIRVNALLLSIFVSARAGGHSDEMEKRGVGALLDPPGVAMAVEGDREPRPRFLGSETALESERDAKNVVRRLARVVVAPVGGQVVDGGLAGDERSILALEGELAFVALVVEERGGARAP